MDIESKNNSNNRVHKPRSMFTNLTTEKNYKLFLGVKIWIHTSTKNTVIKDTYWSERIIDVELTLEEGNYHCLDSTPQKKEELKEKKFV
jgi:hypothetical protein